MDKEKFTSLSGKITAFHVQSQELDDSPLRWVLDEVCCILEEMFIEISKPAICRRERGKPVELTREDLIEIIMSDGMTLRHVAESTVDNTIIGLLPECVEVMRKIMKMGLNNKGLIKSMKKEKSLAAITSNDNWLEAIKFVQNTVAPVLAKIEER